mmetsp:Transcript_146996/g.409481  ORF Transcript_146996/g.409481 Transcript_146996/m.409481 type:complete len:317 (+) Transcript_146996:331-1281(+)
MRLGPHEGPVCSAHGVHVTLAEHGHEEVHQGNAHDKTHEDHHDTHNRSEYFCTGRGDLHVISAFGCQAQVGLVLQLVEVHVPYDRHSVNDESSVFQCVYSQRVVHVDRGRQVHDQHCEKELHIPHGVEDGQDSHAHNLELPQLGQEPQPLEIHAETEDNAVHRLVNGLPVGQVPTDDREGESQYGSIEDVATRLEVPTPKALRDISDSRTDLLESRKKYDRQRQPIRNVQRVIKSLFRLDDVQPHKVSHLSRCEKQLEPSMDFECPPLQIHEGTAPCRIEDLLVLAVGDGHHELQVPLQVRDTARVEVHGHEDVRR